MRFGEQEDVCGEANRARRSRPPRAPHAQPSHWGGPCGRGKRTARSWQRRASPLSRVELLSPRHLKPMVNHCNECYQLARGPSCEAWQQFNMLIIPRERACMLSGRVEQLICDGSRAGPARQVEYSFAFGRRHWSQWRNMLAQVVIGRLELGGGQGGVKCDHAVAQLQQALVLVGYRPKSRHARRLTRSPEASDAATSAAHAPFTRLCAAEAAEA